MPIIKKSIKLLLLILVTSGSVFAIVMLAIFSYFGRNLPDYSSLKVYEPPVVTRIYAGDGSIFAEYASQRRVFIPVDAVPENLKAAFIASEDKNFYYHFGVDFISVIKAVIRNIKRIRNNKRLVGASTLTQQVARNFLLKDTARILSWKRKIKEVILSLRLESTFSKGYILELYLNEIYLGARSYGVGAASLNYFNKGVRDLTLAECAFIAALPKAPSTYRRDLVKAKERRDWVLKRMYIEGYITQEEMTKAQNTPIVLKNRIYKHLVEDGYFAEEVRRTLVKNFGKQKLYQSGMVVRSTMHSKIQAIATNALRKGLINHDRKHGWRGPIINVIERDKDLNLTTNTPIIEPESESVNEEKIQDYGNEVDLSSIFVKTAIGQVKEDKPQPEPQILFNKDIATAEIKKFKKPAIALPQWDIAIVSDVNKQFATIIPQNAVKKESKEGNSTHVIVLDEVKWAKKYINIDEVDEEVSSMSQVLQKGDIIYIEKTTDNKTIAKWQQDFKDPTKFYSLCQIPAISGAIVVMNPHDGKILGMSGGFNWRSSQFNRATQAYRQIGSVIKPFLILSALEMGYAPNYMVSDDPISIDLGPEQGMWKPRNISRKFYGLITLRRLVENSHNVAAVRLVHEITGIKRIMEVLKRFNVYDNPPALYSTALGAGESTLIRIAAAFAMFINGGHKITPTLIDRIQDRYGRNIHLANTRKCLGQCNNIEWSNDLSVPELVDNRQLITNPIYAYQILNILEGTATLGSSWKAKAALKFDVACKTGTSSDNKDVYVIGATNNMLCAVYVGHDNHKTLGNDTNQSSYVVLPIFIDFMKQASKIIKPKPFKIPSGIRIVKINRNTGKAAQSGEKGWYIINEAFKAGTEPLVTQDGKTSDFEEKAEEILTMSSGEIF